MESLDSRCARCALVASQCSCCAVIDNDKKRARMADALSKLPVKKVAVAGPAPSTRDLSAPAPASAAAASCSPLQSISRPVLQPAPPPSLPPPVDARPYQQRKCSLLYTDPLPSVIHLDKFNVVNSSQYGTVEGFSNMSEAEQLLLARRLKANPCHVTSLSVCGNCTNRNAQREMVEAISCRRRCRR